MSAPIPVSPSATSGETRLYEPSMEDILASIRRIIADDQSLPGHKGVDVQAPPVEDTSASVHHLRTDEVEKPVETMVRDVEDGAMTVQGSVAAPQFASPDGPMPADPPIPTAVHAAAPVPDPIEDDHDVMSPSQSIETAAERIEPRAAAGVEPAAALLSTAANNAVSSAFNMLAASRLADNSVELLDMTRDMVRPLLRAWLDDNLPALVERLVRDEIERVARGGR